MIKSLSFTGVPVRDQARSQEFFVSKLGFETRTDAPYGEDRWIEVAPPGAETGFVLFKKPAAKPKSEGSPPDFVLKADDVQKTYETLAGRGVSFVQTPVKQSWSEGMYAIFVDPDGNTFMIGD